MAIKDRVKNPPEHQGSQEEQQKEKVLEKGLATTAYLYNDLTILDEFHAALEKAKGTGIGVWSIHGYAHVDHDLDYHYEDEKEVAQTPDPKPAHGCGDFLTTSLLM